MPKPHPIQINIPNPCHQNWEEMTPDGRGRHCDHCRKTVVDFTTWSDAALYNFFSKNIDKVCGRFFAAQTARPIHIPHQPHSSLYRLTITLGLTILFANSVDGYAQPQAPLVTQGINAGGDSVGSLQVHSGEISGIILKGRGAPVEGALVVLLRDTVYERSVQTDSLGAFSIRYLAPGIYRILVDAAYYETEVVESVVVTNSTPAVLSVKMALHISSGPGRTFMSGEVSVETPRKASVPRGKTRRKPAKSTTKTGK